jgi:hypothetical protein
MRSDLDKGHCGPHLHGCRCGLPSTIEAEAGMGRHLLKRISAVALAGSLFVAGGVIAAPAASAVQGKCGTILTYSAKNSSCSYLIQHFAITGGNLYHYGTKAGRNQTSIQLTCWANVSGYGVLNNV